MSIQNILVAVDGSEASLKLVSWARQLAQGRNAKILLLHVLAPPPHLPLDRLGVTRPQVHEAQLEWAGSLLDRLGGALENLTVERVIEAGAPADVICAQAEERRADLIVLGSRGMGAIGRWYLGSVSTRVVQQSKRPVLVVP